MKRKVNRVGTGTLTVSLPSAWTKKHNVKYGDELEVVEENSKLTISGHFEQQPQKATIKLHGSWRLKRRYIYNAYRLGFDEVTVRYENTGDFKLIQEFLDSMIGFEITEQGKDYCTMKTITTPSYAEFENIVRKYFLTLLNMAEETYTALKERNHTYLENISLQDLSLNKFYMFLTRMLRMKEDVSTRPTMFFYQIIGGIESLGDFYRDICRYYFTKQCKIGKEVLAFMQAVNHLLRVTYDFFYQFDKEKAEFFFIETEKLEKGGTSLLETGVKDEKVLVHYLLTINTTIYNLNSSLFATHIQKE